ncbi:MAG: hypothetical protein VB017_05790, partial [Endomicrobiaceae bacterium]|nr:hypothetical protein [Endomicrobiaceae bacterium]
GKYIGDEIEADMNVLQWYGSKSEMAKNITLDNISSVGVLDQIVKSAQEEGQDKLAKSLKKLSSKTVIGFADTSDLSLTLLKTLGYKKIAAQIETAEKTAETEFAASVESAFKPSASGLSDEAFKEEKEKFVADRVSAMKASIKTAVVEKVLADIEKQGLSESDVKAVKAILNVENKTDAVQNTASEGGKVIEFVKSCAQTAVEGFGVEYSAEKTFGDYVLDTLKVAGIAEAAVKATEALLGTVRGNLGDNYEYAIVNDASKIKTKVAAYYTNEKGEGHVATVDSEAALKAEEMNGFTFTGIVIADKKEITATNGLGTIYNKEALKNVMKKIDTSKLNAQEAATAEEVMGEVVNGVTAPSELSKTLEYVLNIWSRDTGAMLEYIGLDKGTELSNTKAIVQAATDKMAEAIEMGKKGELSGAEVRTEIALVTTLRDLLITSSKEAKGKEWVATAGAEEILTKLVISKAVNQNVIIAGMEKENSGKAEEFVIDIQKLQKAISDKNIVFAKDAKIDDVMDMLKDKKTDKYITPMMRLSDIKAVAAAA